MDGIGWCLMEWNFVLASFELHRGGLLSAVMMIDLQRWPGQIRYWAKHCAINTLPSFGIALILLDLWQSPAAIMAMLLAVFCFVIGYSVVTSMPALFPDQSSLTSRALALGTKIRMWLSGASVVVGLIPGAFFVLPDFWAGMLAVSLLQSAFGLMGVPFFQEMGSERMRPQEAFLTTLLEGLILSFGLMMLSFFILIILQIRERRGLARSAGI